MTKDTAILTEAKATKEAVIKLLITNNVMGSNEVQEELLINRSRLHALVESGKLEPIKELKRESLFFRGDVIALKEEMLKDTRTNLFKKEVLKVSNE